MKKYYIVTAVRRDERKTKRKYPITGQNISEATRTAETEIDNLWEIVKIKFLG
jgi:hypothetical protein